MCDCRYAQDQPKLQETMKVPQIATRYVPLNVEMTENPAGETAERCRPSSDGKMVLIAGVTCDRLFHSATSANSHQKRIVPARDMASDRGKRS